MCQGVHLRSGSLYRSVPPLPHLYFPRPLWVLFLTCTPDALWLHSRYWNSHLPCNHLIPPHLSPPSLHLISSSATHRYTGMDLLFPCQFIKVAMCLMPLSSSHLYLYLTCSCFVPVSCSGFTCILICRLFTRLAAVPLWMTLPLQTPFLMSTHACLTVLRAFRGHFRRYVFELSACFRLLLVQSLFAFTCSETVAVLSRRRCDDFAAFVNDDHSITS